MFSLTNAIFWLYSWLAIAKSMDGFSSLLSKRILPLCGFFCVRKSLRLRFLRAEVWEAFGLAGLRPGLLTRIFRPLVSRTGGGFLETVQTKEHES